MLDAREWAAARRTPPRWCAATPSSPAVSRRSSAASAAGATKPVLAGIGKALAAFQETLVSGARLSTTSGTRSPGVMLLP
jgi:hypothetical protein